MRLKRESYKILIVNFQRVREISITELEMNPLLERSRRSDISSGPEVTVFSERKQRAHYTARRNKYTWCGKFNVN